MQRLLGMALALLSAPGAGSLWAQDHEGHGHEPKSVPEKAALQPLVLELGVFALANEGFLLKSGGQSVLIDGFVAEPYSVYGSLPPEVLEQMMGGVAPFVSVDVALASHYHRDHFQAETALSFLFAQPDCHFVSSPQVLTALQNVATELEAPLPEQQLQELFPEPGERKRFLKGTLLIEFLHLSHGTGRFAQIQNQGHLIHINGVTALHVGDAAMVPAHFEPYQLSKRGIDVAFVPYWYFDDEDGRTVIQEHFRPAQLVACHIPPGELKAVTKRLAESDPKVIVPSKALQEFHIKNLN